MKKFLLAVAAVCALALPGFARRNATPEPTPKHSAFKSSSHKHHWPWHHKSGHQPGKPPKVKGH
jgi:hypothetical protein